ncbi:MAG TPA: hypothetical protein V6C76_07900 [Drouetiella sp.]
MIECPICHVMNEDQAHFCSECGQRFGPAASQPSFQQSGPSASEPVFPSFPPTDPNQQQNFQQPQAVQEYQQNSFNAPQNQGFGNPNNPPGFGAPQQQGFGGQPQGNYNPSFGGSPSPADLLNNPMGSASVHQKPSAPTATETHQDPPSFNAVQPAVSESIAENHASDKNPNALPPRPKLHSPLFDGPDEPAHGHSSPKSAFGGGKPKGLRSPMLGEDDSEAEPPKPRGGGLRSPLLRGEDDPDHPQRGRGSQRSSLLGGGNNSDEDHSSPGKPAKGGGLRSPLLGASEDDFVPQPKAPKVPKGLPQQKNSSAHLRSPLLGASDDFEGEDDMDLPVAPGKSAFPHVKRPAARADHDADTLDQSSSGKMPSKKFRSPLLGDSSDDEPAHAGGRPMGGGRPKLHSPIMDGPGSQNYESEYDEPYYEEIDDPNALRSPLLAARSHHVEPAAPKPKAPEAKAPSAQPQAKFPSTNSFAEPSSGAQQAEFRDRGFPESQPQSDMWRDRGFSESPNVQEPAPQPRSSIRPGPVPVAPSSPPEVAPSIKESSHSSLPRRSSRSGLLGAGSDDFDEQPINNFRAAPPAPPKPAMILIVPCFMAVAAKLWYMALMGAALMSSPPFLADQLMQLVVIIALIIFGMGAGKK